MFLQEVTQQNQALEIFKIILPFITLVLGFILGRWEKWRDEKKNIDNIRTIFFWELNSNVLTIKAIREDFAGNDLESHKQRCAHLELLNHEVYDQYFDRINLLSSVEVFAILSLYSYLKSLKPRVRKYEEVLNAIPPLGPLFERNNPEMPPWEFESDMEQLETSIAGFMVVLAGRNTKLQDELETIFEKDFKTLKKEVWEKIEKENN